MPRSVGPSVCPTWPRCATAALQATRAVRTVDLSAHGRRSSAIGEGHVFLLRDNLFIYVWFCCVMFRFSLFGTRLCDWREKASPKLENARQVLAWSLLSFLSDRPPSHHTDYFCTSAAKLFIVKKNLKIHYTFYLPHSVTSILGIKK